MPSNDGLTIRTARLEDLPALVEIDTTATSATRTDYLREKVRQAVESHQATTVALVAESAGKIVGFLMGQVLKGEFGVREAVAFVDTVDILAEHQGRGVGRRLMGEFLLVTKQAKAVQVRTIVDWNQWDLLGFFRTLGFAPGTGIVLQRRV